METAGNSVQGEQPRSDHEGQRENNAKEDDVSGLRDIGNKQLESCHVRPFGSGVRREPSFAPRRE